MNMQLTTEQRTIASQRAKIDELEEQLRQMRRMPKLEPVGPTFPKHWGLTPTQHRMLAAFAQSPKGFVDHGRLITASGSAATDKTRVINVQIMNLRRAVQYLGIKIINRYGYGYEVPPESMAFIKAALDGEVE